MLIKNQQLLKSTPQQLARKEKIIRLARSASDGACYLSPLEESHAQYMRDFFAGMTKENFPCTVSCMERTGAIAREKGLRRVTGTKPVRRLVRRDFCKERGAESRKLPNRCRCYSCPSHLGDGAGSGLLCLGGRNTGSYRRRNSFFFLSCGTKC